MRAAGRHAAPCLHRAPSRFLFPSVSRCTTPPPARQRALARLNFPLSPFPASLPRSHAARPWHRVALRPCSRGWGLQHILNTHHHSDHVGGNLELKRRYGAAIVGPAADRDRIPGIDTALADGDSFPLFGTTEVKVFDTPGHTRGHVAFWLPSEDALFPGACPGHGGGGGGFCAVVVVLRHARWLRWVVVVTVASLRRFGYSDGFELF